MSDGHRWWVQLHCRNDYEPNYHTQAKALKSLLNVRQNAKMISFCKLKFSGDYSPLAKFTVAKWEQCKPTNLRLLFKFRYMV